MIEDLKHTIEHLNEALDDLGKIVYGCDRSQVERLIFKKEYLALAQSQTALLGLLRAYEIDQGDKP